VTCISWLQVSDPTVDTGDTRSRIEGGQVYADVAIYKVLYSILAVMRGWLTYPCNPKSIPREIFKIVLMYMIYFWKYWLLVNWNKDRCYWLLYNTDSYASINEYKSLKSVCVNVFIFGIGSKCGNTDGKKKSHWSEEKHIGRSEQRKLKICTILAIRKVIALKYWCLIRMMLWYCFTQKEIFLWFLQDMSCKAYIYSTTAYKESHWDLF